MFGNSVAENAPQTAAVKTAETDTLLRVLREELAADFQELQKVCKWKWTKLNGVKGYMATSKKTGNSIFFPVTGLWNLYGFDDCPYGFYWSSTLYGMEQATRAINFDMDRHSHGSGTCERYFGLPIRPVQE